MEQSNQSKKVLLSVIGVAILVVAVVGVSFAFFNYTRTGGTQTLQTGNIQFVTTNPASTMSNLFPITLTSGGLVNSADYGYTGTATVSITGSTAYNNGLIYQVRVSALSNTINGKQLPISVEVTDNFAANAPTNHNIGVIANGSVLSEGTVPKDANVSGVITVRAFIDATKVAITDTYDNTTVVPPTGENNVTPESFVTSRTRFTTAEWNGITSGTYPITFKITVEAVQGGASYLGAS